MNSLTFRSIAAYVPAEKNWSQETLCGGICTVSYLSKIEQGKAQPNDALLRELFAMLDVARQTIPQEEGERLCEYIYDLVFSDDKNEPRKMGCFGRRLLHWAQIIWTT